MHLHLHSNLQATQDSETRLRINEAKERDKDMEGLERDATVCPSHHQTCMSHLTTQHSSEREKRERGGREGRERERETDRQTMTYAHSLSQ